MKQVDIHEAKTHLSRLIQDVQAGEEVVIARETNPLFDSFSKSRRSPPANPTDSQVADRLLTLSTRTSGREFCDRSQGIGEALRRF